MCIIRDGEVACPTKMPQRTVLGASFDDKRSCGPCTCSPSGCGTGGQITVYHNATCTQTYWHYDVDGKCAQGGASTAVDSVSYRASTGCSVATAPAILGTVSVTAPRTLCCTQF
jgi:hypothetical protein